LTAEATEESVGVAKTLNNFSHWNSRENATCGEISGSGLF